MRSKEYRKLWEDISKRMPVGSSLNIKEDADGKYTRFSVTFDNSQLSFQTWYNTRPGPYKGTAVCWYGAAEPLANGIFGHVNQAHRTKATDSFPDFDENFQTMVDQINHVFTLMETGRVFATMVDNH